MQDRSTDGQKKLRMKCGCVVYTMEGRKIFSPCAACGLNRVAQCLKMSGSVLPWRRRRALNEASLALQAVATRIREK